MARPKLTKFPQLFPHNSRNYSRIILVLIFLFLASFLIEKGKTYANIDDENIASIYEKLREKPNSEVLHFKLGRALQKNGNFDDSIREFLIAKELGLQPTLVNDALIQIQNSKISYVKVSGELAKWQKIVTEKPDYRDGWYQLSLLQWRISEIDQAKQSITKAIEIDPNYKPAVEFRNFLES